MMAKGLKVLFYITRTDFVKPCSKRIINSKSFPLFHFSCLLKTVVGLPSKEKQPRFSPFEQALNCLSILLVLN